MRSTAIHTSDAVHADRVWRKLGGHIEAVRRTGEKRYTHARFAAPLTINGRRQDVPGKLLSRLNQLLRMEALDL